VNLSPLDAEAISPPVDGPSTSPLVAADRDPSAFSSTGERSRVHAWLVRGPDPIEPAEPVGWLEVLLPWPLRLLAVLAIVLAAGWWRATGIGQELTRGLQAGSLAALAIVASLWWQVLLADVILAVPWFAPFPRSSGTWRALFHVVTFINRQIGHLWAFFVWFVIALSSLSRLDAQLGAVAALVLLGPPIINGIARSSLPPLGPDTDSKATGDLLWRRRYLIYLATALGLLVLALLALEQLDRLAPLLIAVGAGIVLRAARHARRNQQATDAAMRKERESFRRAQADTARRADPLVMLLVPLAFAGLVVFSWSQRRALDRAQNAARAESHQTHRTGVAPSAAEVALFLMADAQTHELGGAPFPGQTALTQVFVSSARRPLALDMLALVPVRLFGAIAAEMNYRRVTRGQSAMAWAHLGDLADLACERELDAVSQALAPLTASTPLAGVALGNHEMSFDGSFHWSPYWDRSCASGRLEKDEAIGRVVERFGAALPEGSGTFVPLPASPWYPHGGSLSVVRNLGAVHHRGRPRMLLGIFLDTSDGRAFDWGMPGSVGAVSRAQLDAVGDALAPLQADAAAAGSEPVYVVFSHIPLGDLADTSHDRVTAWLTDLDGRRGDLASEPRVIAYLSAHRHVASSQRHCVGNRYLREITIGSTTDPPQQAAVVEVGPDAQGQLVLSVRSLQAVARPNSTVEPPLGIDAATCRAVVYDLSKQPACRYLLAPAPNAAPPRDCQALERTLSRAERLHALTLDAMPRDAELALRFQRLDAERVLGCVCRDAACQTDPDPLSDDSHWRSLEEAWSMPGRRDELGCLAWAASAAHAHQDTGMTLEEALRCSFDDPTMAAEQSFTAALENATCD
jgi:hypothetical protein